MSVLLSKEELRRVKKERTIELDLEKMQTIDGAIRYLTSMKEHSPEGGATGLDISTSGYDWPELSLSYYEDESDSEYDIRISLLQSTKEAEHKEKMKAQARRKAQIKIDQLKKAHGIA